MSEKLVLETGEEHGLINQLANSTKDKTFKHAKPENKVKLEKQMKEDGRIVKARYVNHQERNGRLEVPYCKWPGEPIRMYKLISGHEYEVPKGLIDQVNSSVMPQRSEILDRNGQPTQMEGQGIRVHELLPTRF